jgi:hypothetical protein
VLDALQLLVEHSLVQHSGESEPSTFHMLETVRAFAFEHLTVSGEESILRNQHLAACVAFAEQAEPQLRSAAQLEWLSQIDHVYDNLRAALVWGLDQADDPERLTLGLRLAGSLWYYWYIRGRSQEAFRWLDHSAMADERLPVALRAHALLSHWFIVSETLQPEGFTTYVYGLALAERAGDHCCWPMGCFFLEIPTIGRVAGRLRRSSAILGGTSGACSDILSSSRLLIAASRTSGRCLPPHALSAMVCLSA